MELTLALLLLMADYNQSIQIAESPHYHETNLILGKSPKKSAIHAYFASAALATYAISKTRFKKIGVKGVIIVESIYVMHNTNIGINVQF